MQKGDNKGAINVRKRGKRCIEGRRKGGEMGAKRGTLGARTWPKMGEKGSKRGQKEQKEASVDMYLVNAYIWNSSFDSDSSTSSNF